MLNRRQIHTLLLIRNREGNMLSQIPPEIVREISEFGQDPNGDAATLLHHVAYGEEEKAEKMLKANPELLLQQVSHVVTPSGLTIKYVTPYECALGGGDPEMAAMMTPYFAKLGDGEKEQVAQYERYRPHIEAMLKQEPYYLSWLIDIIKQSSAQDVTAALNKNMEHESVLRDALIQFRHDFKPGVMKKPGMHFKYKDLIHAFDIYDREFDHLANGNNYDKCRLFCRQVIGYEMRNLPARDRQIFAQSLYNVVNGEKPSRSCEFKNDKGHYFPVASGDDSLSGLGFDFYVDIFGPGDGCNASCAARRRSFTKLISSKNFSLAELMQPHPRQKTPECVIC